MSKAKMPASLGDVEFDMLVTQSDSYTADAPEYPVEDGYNVSDSIILKATVLDITAYITSTYYWWVDARKFNNEEEDDMDQAKFNEMFRTAMADYRQELRDNDSGGWSQEARDFAVAEGIFAGSGTTPDGQPNMMWEDFLTREQCAQVLYRFAKKYGLA